VFLCLDGRTVKISWRPHVLVHSSSLILQVSSVQVEKKVMMRVQWVCWNISYINHSPTQTYLVQIWLLPTNVYFVIWTSISNQIEQQPSSCFSLISLNLLWYTGHNNKSCGSIPCIVTFYCAMYFLVFPSSHPAILFTGMLVTITFTNDETGWRQRRLEGKMRVERLRTEQLNAAAML
jgi:hypothetical protein